MRHSHHRATRHAAPNSKSLRSAAAAAPVDAAAAPVDPASSPHPTASNLSAQPARTASSCQSARSTRSSGSVTRMRTPRNRSEDQRVNLRRSYQALMRKLRSGESSGSTYQTWPIRPYAASL